MTEKFLHYLWKMKLLRQEKLFTATGEKILIIKSGQPNMDAGPDFMNARIKIGETEWAGNIEIHVRSSEWNSHRHQLDAAYNNVVLHVVYSNDEEVMSEGGRVIPILELKGAFDEKILDTYRWLVQSRSWIPCEPQLKKTEPATIGPWLHRLLVERLEHKVEVIQQSLLENQFNWEETFYQSIAAAFGARVNAEPFRMLARQLPLKILAKHKNDLFQLEALLFGMAGFLDESLTGEYPRRLKKEFDFLQKRHRLMPLKKHVWKFLRLRPANFPTIRLAQFAGLVFHSSHLLSKILDQREGKRIIELIRCEASPYWNEHYRFDQRAAASKKILGNEMRELILINTVAPFLFVYGKLHDDEPLQQRSFDLLEQLAPENNAIIRRWKSSGVTARNAYDSQALLQLKNHYCNNVRCLECSIGHHLLTKSAVR
jgi:hypothetical protein